MTQNPKLKMSESFAKLLNRNKNGYLNCKFCSKIFATTTGIDFHLKIDHGISETLTQEEPKIKQEQTDDNKEMQKTETKKQKSTRSTENQGGEVNLNKFLECKKSLLHLNEPIRTDNKKFADDQLKRFVSIATQVDMVHENIKPHKCPHCLKNIMYNKTLQNHIKTIHEKLKPVKSEKEKSTLNTLGCI